MSFYYFKIHRRQVKFTMNEVSFNILEVRIISYYNFEEFFKVDYIQMVKNTKLYTRSNSLNILKNKLEKDGKNIELCNISASHSNQRHKFELWNKGLLIVV